MNNPPPVIPDNAESIRREHLSHEASIQGIGSLYLLGAVLLGLAAIVLLFAPGQVGSLVVAAVCAIFAALEIWLGLGLRRLDAKVRTVATIFACLGLLGFPLGTLINGYILYLLHSQRGKMVFSDRYRDIIAATPHIKYKTSWVAWAFLILVVVILLVAIVAAVTSQP